MPVINLTQNTWVKIANTGEFPFLQNQGSSPIALAISNTTPSDTANVEILYNYYPYKTYNYPIPNDLYITSLNGSGKVYNVNYSSPTISGNNVAVNVSSLPSLPAGSSIIGVVGVDQTIDGTTNKVFIGNTGIVTARIQDSFGANLSTTTISGKNRLDVVLPTSSTPGSSIAPLVDVIAGSDGTLTRTVLTDNVGKLQITQSPGTIATNQISVGTSPTLISSARTGRTALTIVNHGTTDVFIGTSNVSNTSGILLTGTRGQTLVFDGSASVYGIVSSGTQTVSFVETF